MPAVASNAAAGGGAARGREQVERSVADVFVDKLRGWGVDLSDMLQGTRAPFASWLEFVMSEVVPAATGVLSSAAAMAAAVARGGEREGLGTVGALHEVLRGSAEHDATRTASSAGVAAEPLQTGLVLQLLRNWVRGLRAGKSGKSVDSREAVAGGVTLQLGQEMRSTAEQQQPEQAAQVFAVLWLSWLQSTASASQKIATTTTIAAAAAGGGGGVEGGCSAVDWAQLAADAMRPGQTQQQLLQQVLPAVQPTPADVTAMQAAAVQHMPCDEPCDKPLACGHSCSSTCHAGATSCGRCQQQCGLRCRHARCHRQCSAPCAPCAEPCGWFCEHQGPCLLPCGAPCDRLPCNERCSKVLGCGHRCPGVCGEECPADEYCTHPECCAGAPERVRTQVCVGEWIHGCMWM
jgi:hypothetical protein